MWTFEKKEKYTRCEFYYLGGPSLVEVYMVPPDGAGGRLYFAGAGGSWRPELAGVGSTNKGEV